MPHFNVHMFEEALDGEVEPATIRALTDALVEVYGERARELAVVEILGIPRHRWGIGGTPAVEHRPSPCTCASRPSTWSTTPPSA